MLKILCEDIRGEWRCNVFHHVADVWRQCLGCSYALHFVPQLLEECHHVRIVSRGYRGGKSRRASSLVRRLVERRNVWWSWIGRDRSRCRSGFAGGWGFRGISHRAFSCCLWSWPWRVPGLGLWTRLGGANLRVSPLSAMSSSWPRRSKVDGCVRSVLASTKERELCEAAGWFRGLGSTIARLA